MKRILLTLLAAVSVSLMAAAKTDLSKYVIVYPASAEAEEGLDIAEAVASAVEASTGVRLPVVSDETPEVRRERNPPLSTPSSRIPSTMPFPSAGTRFWSREAGAGP